MIERRRIRVEGIVQGVGFRPYVYRLAVDCGLTGWVINDSLGVVIEAQGEPPALELFVGRLPKEAPTPAMVTGVKVEKAPLGGEADFTIRHSRKESAAATLISPDMAVCGDCLTEMRHPGNRRYRYPFINCTNCGPRYTIIEDIPYDRPATSMKAFAMCRDCAAEYEDPKSRRFHAQPNACPVCGPSPALLEADGSPAAPGLDPITETIRRLKEGQIAAVKGLGGFHLAVDAANCEAVQRLRRRKLREEKPLAVMVADTAAADRAAHLDAEEISELGSARSPIILLPRRAGSPIAAAVAPGNPVVGIMLPYTPLHHLLFDEGLFTALVMTSGNQTDEPICIGNGEAVRRLAGIADFFLVHNRDIYWRGDDSVLRFFGGRPMFTRRSRGYVPVPVILGRAGRSVMGLGAELKNTVCLSKGNFAFPSQHIGDLANEETLAFFERTIAHLERILECRAEVLAHDMHPDYLSTRFALEQTERPAVAVQHHHAHAVSCMAENRLEGQVLAATFDGTGYGVDGHVWGGEFLVAGLGSFKRAAHFAEVLMPGGDAAIREPWRMALAYLHRLLGPGALRSWPAIAQRIPAAKLEAVLSMLNGGVNCLPTSSCGRFFDAVSSLLGIRDAVTFEGQAAMELEFAAADDFRGPGYPFVLDTGTEMVIIDTMPAVAAILEDSRSGRQPGWIAGRFHETIAVVIRTVMEELRRRWDLNRVVLSGGVFQNMKLLRRAVDLLRAGAFDVYWHTRVPANDGGISLGQALVAREIFDNPGAATDAAR